MRSLKHNSPTTSTGMTNDAAKHAATGCCLSARDTRTTWNVGSLPGVK